MGPALVAGVFMLVHFGLSHLLSGRPSQLNRDAELYHQLPDDSPVRADLLRSIETRAKKYTEPRKWQSLVASPTTYFVLNLVIVLSVSGLLGYSALEVRNEQAQRTQATEAFRDAMRQTADERSENRELLEQLRAELEARSGR